MLRRPAPSLPAQQRGGLIGFQRKPARGDGDGVGGTGRGHKADTEIAPCRKKSSLFQKGKKKKKMNICVPSPVLSVHTVKVESPMGSQPRGHEERKREDRARDSKCKRTSLAEGGDTGRKKQGWQESGVSSRSGDGAV